MYLTEKASKRQIWEAENARDNRLEIVKALSVHEDNAMLIRWEINRGMVAMPSPNPTPQPAITKNSNSDGRT